MLQSLHVEHESRQRAMQPGNRPFHHGEARAGKLHARIKIQTQRVAHIDVVFDVKCELGLVAPSAHHRIAMLIRAHGHAGMWQIG